MANTGFKGIDILSTSLLVRVFALKDATGAKITSGTATYRIFELQSDGSLKSYDFNDNTFKTTALTTATVNLTHQTGNNGGYNTGLWTNVMSTLTGFTKGAMYVEQITHTSLAPTEQEREFQFGSVEGEVSGVDLETVLRRVYAATAGDAVVAGSGPFTIEYDGPDGTIAVTTTANGGNRANSYS